MNMTVRAVKYPTTAPPTIWLRRPFTTSSFASGAGMTVSPAAVTIAGTPRRQLIERPNRSGRPSVNVARMRTESATSFTSRGVVRMCVRPAQANNSPTSELAMSRLQRVIRTRDAPRERTDFAAASARRFCLVAMRSVR